MKDLGTFIEEKWVRNGKICHFLGITRKWYQYPLHREEVVPVAIKVVPIPIDRRGLVPIPIKVVPIPMLPATLFLYPLHC